MKRLHQPSIKARARLVHIPALPWQRCACQELKFLPVYNHVRFSSDWDVDGSAMGCGSAPGRPGGRGAPRPGALGPDFPPLSALAGPVRHSDGAFLRLLFHGNLESIRFVSSTTNRKEFLSSDSSVFSVETTARRWRSSL